MSTGIQKYRENRDLSQQQLADLADTTRATISRLETGQRQLTQKWAERLAPHLGVQPHILFLREGEVEQETRTPVVGVVGVGVWQEVGQPIQPSVQLSPVLARPGILGSQVAFEVLAQSGIEGVGRGAFILTAETVGAVGGPGARVIAVTERDGIFQRVAGIASTEAGKLSVLIDGEPLEVTKITHVVVGVYIAY